MRKSVGRAIKAKVKLSAHSFKHMYIKHAGGRDVAACMH